ncbi:MAG: amidase [Propionibacteriaceae bacterium]|jgi:Asp-tRNA(Asn)/Glu-tRNA(Gln) amidotransferase A subunit family amidase|nr:amidase [Propionibacteriaceae bacterium]
MRSHTFLKPHARSIALSSALLLALVTAGCSASDATESGGEVPATTGDYAATATAGSQPADVTAYTVTQARNALEAGDITSAALTQAFLDRIATYESAYNAFVTMNPTALAEAEASDQRRAAGEELGPLDGVPIVVKDSINMAGLRTSSGWSGFWPEAGGVELIPEKDAAVVARLRAAGAIILGKTNLPIFAGSGSNANNSVAGPTFNVLNRDWAPGGSSTGTATSVAAGFAVTGIAEETGGSIQNPASAQSLVAIKPTFALVPNSGGVPLAGSTRDVFGPIAKTVEDAALMLDIIAGYTLEDPKTNAGVGKLPADGYTSQLSDNALAGTRIGLYGLGWRDTPLSDETQSLYDRAIEVLKSQGATVVEDPFAGTDFAALAEVGEESGYDSRGSEDLAYELDRYLQGLGASASVHSLAELEAATGVQMFGPGGPLENSAETLPGLKASLADPTAVPDMTEFTTLRTNYLRIFNEVMATHDLDALVYPQQIEAIGGLYDSRIKATTVSEINIAGLPGVVLPDGQYEAGQPFSLIFVGPQWSEASLLGYAYDYGLASPGRLIVTELETTPGPEPKE